MAKVAETSSGAVKVIMCRWPVKTFDEPLGAKAAMAKLISGVEFGSPSAVKNRAGDVRVVRV